MSMVDTMDEPPDDADGKTIEAEAAEGDQALPTQNAPISALPAGRQFDVLSGWLKLDMDQSREWRQEARECFAFRAGDQWTPEDKALLAGQGRPVIVFNRVLTILKAVAGMEINGRHEIAFIPRGSEDTKANEVLTAASKWMADSTDAEDEESDAFDDCTTCGMGWTEERMSYEDDPAGLYVQENVDPLEMYWDRTARKKMKGARRIARVRRMPLGDAMSMFPNFTKEQLDAVWAADQGGDYPERSIEERRKRDTESSMLNYDDGYEVTIVQIQWIEREVYWLVADQATSSKAELSDAQYQKFKARMAHFGMTVPAARLTRKVYKQAFLGAKDVMLKKAGPSPIKGGFSWQCITGEYDKPKGCWFGLVRILRDPQMWANKWLSQILHLLNSTAKGGVIAERGAFDDEREAEDNYALPEAIVWAADGALSNANGPKIIDKPGKTSMTGEYVGLLTFAIQAFKDVSGINLELLGQQDQNQPGVLEMMRKQAGMTVLATLFNSLRRFHKAVGRNRLFFIQTYLSDGRLIRVAEVDTDPRAVALAKDKTVGMYDVVVDDTPTSPNQKEANWAIIQPLLVVFKEQLMANPAVLAMLLEYSPLPSRIVEAVKKFVMENANDPETQKIKEIAMAREISEIEKNKSVANLNNAKAGGAQSTALYEISMAQNLLHDNKREELRAHLELMKDAAKAREAELKAAGDSEDRQIRQQSDTLKGHAALADAGTRRMVGEATAHRAISDAETNRMKVHAEIGGNHIGKLIEHLAARSTVARDHAAATKDHAQARLLERTPGRQPAGAQ